MALCTLLAITTNGWCADKDLFEELIWKPYKQANNKGYEAILLTLDDMPFDQVITKTEMNETLFWSLIEKARGVGFEKEHAERLKNQLKLLTPQQIIGFYQLYGRYLDKADLGDVWAACELLNSGYCSDDGYRYFRDWLIAQGQDIYTKALSNPDSLANVIVETEADGMPFVGWETYAYAPSEAYEKITKRDFYYDLEKLESQEKAENCTNPVTQTQEPTWDWSDYTNAKLAKKLPNLWKKYGKFKMATDKRFNERSN